MEAFPTVTLLLTQAKVIPVPATTYCVPIHIESETTSTLRLDVQTIETQTMLLKKTDFLLLQPEPCSGPSHLASGIPVTQPSSMTT